MKIRLLLLLFSVAFNGCVTRSNPPRVDVETRNLTGQELSEVAIWFGPAVCTSGYLVSTAQATHMYYPSPITDTARVEWTDAAGRRQTRQVNLSQVYKPGQSGLLQIAITESGGIEARMLPLPTLSQK